MVSETSSHSICQSDLGHTLQHFTELLRQQQASSSGGVSIGASPERSPGYVLVWACRIKHQEQWLKQQAAAHKHDPYWQVVTLLQAQVDGLYAGYSAAMTAAEAAAAAAGQQLEVPRLGRDDIIFLNSNGEEDS